MDEGYIMEVAFKVIFIIMIALLLIKFYFFMKPDTGGICIKTTRDRLRIERLRKIKRLKKYGNQRLTKIS